MIYLMDDYHLKMQLVSEIREVLRIKELCLELADATQSTLKWQMDYCRKNNIPILKERPLMDLLNRCESLITRIYGDLPPLHQHPDRTPPDSTEHKPS